MRILIAEDDFAGRKFLSKYLSKYGECDLVEDGFELIETFIKSMKTNQKYDLICLDIMMPKVDGITALKAIREWETRNGLLPEKRVKVLLTTALAEGQHVSNAVDIGCNGYLLKPIEISALDEALSSLGIKKIV